MPSVSIDPDMLEVGNGGMKKDEYIVHFSLWAISKVLRMKSSFPCQVINLLHLVDKNVNVIAGTSSSWLRYKEYD